MIIKKRGFIVASICLLLQISGCKKVDISCLSCPVAIIRYTFTSPRDTAIYDFSFAETPIPATFDSSFVMRGYSMAIDTYFLPSMYKVCLETDVYQNSQSDFSQFYNSMHCVKQ